MFRRILIAAGVLLLVVVGAFAAVIAFNAPTAPPVLAAGNSIPGIAQWNFAELPKPQTPQGARRRTAQLPPLSRPAGSRRRAGARLVAARTPRC